MANSNGNLAPAGGVRFRGENYPAGSRVPQRYFQLREQSMRARDPGQADPNFPPNMGRFPIPHVLTFRGLVTSLSRAYRITDEALRDSEQRAHIMLHDPAVWGPLSARMEMASLLNWHIETEEAGNIELETVAENLTKLVRKTPYLTKYFFSLMSAVWYGRHACQHRWGLWTDPKSHRLRYVIKNWSPISGDKLLFRYDDGTGKFDPDQIGVRVLASQGKDDRIAGRRTYEQTSEGMAYFLQPWERSMVAIHRHLLWDAEYEEPRSAGHVHGLGIRHFLYWTWYQKQETLAQLMEIIERTSYGITLYYYPEGNAAGKTEMEGVAREQGNTNRFMVPRAADGSDAYGIEQFPPNTAGIDALTAVVDDYFSDLITRVILGQTLSRKPDATGLGSGVANLQESSLMQIAKFDAVNLEETLTKELLLPLQLYNFPQYRNAEFQVRLSTNSAAPGERLAAIEKAYQMGAKIRTGDVMDLIGLAEPKGNEEFLSLEQQNAQAQEMGVAPGLQFGGGAEDTGEGFGGGEEEPAQLESSATTASGPVMYKGIRGRVADAAAKVECPTDGQAEAGNYRKGHVTINGIPVTIECAKGDRRKPDWPPLTAHYGYIKRTEGADGEQVDVFVHPHAESEIVFVVDQVDAEGRFDEHKALIGWTSKAKAKAAYLSNYPKGFRCGPISCFTLDDFRAWLEHGPARGLASRWNPRVFRYAQQLGLFDDVDSQGRRQGRIAWDESKHPREASGKPEGGQFASGQSGGGGKKTPQGPDDVGRLLGTVGDRMIARIAHKKKRDPADVRSDIDSLRKTRPQDLLHMLQHEEGEIDSGRGWFGEAEARQAFRDGKNIHAAIREHSPNASHDERIDMWREAKEFYKDEREQAGPAGREPHEYEPAEPKAPSEGRHRARSKQDYRENDIRAEAFKSWFGDWENDAENASKVVHRETGEPTENLEVDGSKAGKPVVMKHGTGSGGFDRFEKRWGQATASNVADDLLYGPGFYFTDDDDIAEEYSQHKPEKFVGRNEDVLASAQQQLGSMEEAGWYDNSELNDLRWAIENLESGNVDFANVGEAEGSSLSPVQQKQAYFAIRRWLPMNEIENLWQKQGESEVKRAYLNIRKPFDADAGDPSLMDLVDESTRSKIRSEQQSQIDSKQKTLDLIQKSLDRTRATADRLGESVAQTGLGLDWDSLKRMSASAGLRLDIRPGGLDLLNRSQREAYRGLSDKQKQDVAEWVSMRKHAESQEPNVAKHAEDLERLKSGTVTYKNIVSMAGSKSAANEWLAANGYDGITHEGGQVTGGKSHRVWIAFEPNQIKAVENQGTFDPEDDRLNYRRIFDELVSRGMRRQSAENFVRVYAQLGLFGDTYDEPPKKPRGGRKQQFEDKSRPQQTSMFGGGQAGQEPGQLDFLGDSGEAAPMEQTSSEGEGGKSPPRAASPEPSGLDALANMSPDEMHDAIWSTAPQNVQQRSEDWGNLRGQGKRSGYMVKGGMRDSSLQGVKHYADLIGGFDDVGDDKDALGSMGDMPQLGYNKARALGLDHDHAMTYALGLHEPSEGESLGQLLHDWMAKSDTEESGEPASTGSTEAAGGSSGWDESKHPRVAAGSEHGGEFTAGQGGGSAPAAWNGADATRPESVKVDVFGNVEYLDWDAESGQWIGDTGTRSDEYVRKQAWAGRVTDSVQGGSVPAEQSNELSNDLEDATSFDQQELQDSFGSGVERTDEEAPDEEAPPERHHLLQRSGDQLRRIEQAFGLVQPLKGDAAAQRIEDELDQLPEGNVIRELLAVDGGPVGYTDNGYADRGMDAFREVLDGKFTRAELNAASDWIQSTYGGYGGLADLRESRFMAGTVKTSRAIDDAMDEAADSAQSAQGDGSEPEPEPEPQVPPGETPEPEPDDPAPTRDQPQQGGLFSDEAPMNSATESPREAAEKAERKLDEDYAFARKSKIGNRGEDLTDSARHRANEWRGIEDAEKQGTAEKSITRDNLFKIEPHNLVSAADDKPLQALAAYFALKKFPARPGYGGHREFATDAEKKKDRRQYLEAWTRIRDTANSAATKHDDPVEVLREIRSEVLNVIMDLRGMPRDSGMSSMAQSAATDPYNNTANSLSSMYQAVAPRNRKATSVAGRLSEFAKAAKSLDNLEGLEGDELMAKIRGNSQTDKAARVTEAARSVIEGRSINAAFGIGGGKGGRRAQAMRLADAYAGNRAMRKGGKQLEFDDPNDAVDHVVDKVKMRGIQWGNWVPDEERAHHAQHIAEACADLADVMGLGEDAASLGGILGLRFGSNGRGPAMAHYEPLKRAINLTRKNGVGSLAHEWGHFLDHHLGSTVKGATRSIGLSLDSLSRKDVGSDPMRDAMDAVRNAWRDSGFRDRINEAGIANMGAHAWRKKGNQDYWTSNEEMFARSFEGWVDHELRAQGRKNTYLSGGLDYEMMPNKEEMEHIAPALRKLRDAYAERVEQQGKYARRLDDQLARYAAWDESQHSREPAGSPAGGQFSSHIGSSGLPNPGAPQWVRDKWQRNKLQSQLSDVEAQEESARKELADWKGRQYKSNPGRIGKKDEFGEFVGTQSIGSVNEKRRASAIKQAQRKLEDAQELRSKLQSQLDKLGPDPDAAKPSDENEGLSQGQQDDYLAFLLGDSSEPAAKYAAWDESKHPRDAEGTDTGGQFTSGQGGGGDLRAEQRAKGANDLGLYDPMDPRARSAEADAFTSGQPAQPQQPKQAPKATPTAEQLNGLQDGATIGGYTKVSTSDGLVFWESDGEAISSASMAEQLADGTIDGGDGGAFTGETEGSQPEMTPESAQALLRAAAGLGIQSQSPGEVLAAAERAGFDVSDPNQAAGQVAMALQASGQVIGLAQQYGFQPQQGLSQIEQSQGAAAFLVARANVQPSGDLGADLSKALEAMQSQAAFQRIFGDIHPAVVVAFLAAAYLMWRFTR